MTRTRTRTRIRTKKLALALVAIAGVIGGFVVVSRARAANHPCAEPDDLPVPRERVVRCVERYVEDQWYTTHLGKLAPLDADPYGHGSWLELASKHRGSLDAKLSQLCTHPKDTAGAMGHVALFESVTRKDSECRAFSVTPLLGASLKNVTCSSVREGAACETR